MINYNKKKYSAVILCLIIVLNLFSINISAIEYKNEQGIKTKSESYISMPDNRINSSDENIEITLATVTGSGGEISYSFYSDEACTEQIDATIDNLPDNEGLYYIKAEVDEDENFSSSSCVAKLYVEKNRDNLEDRINAFITDERWCNGAEYGGRSPILWPDRASYGCCAYAIDFIIMVHGVVTSPGGGTTFYDFNEVREGDILYQYGSWNSNQHYVCVCKIEGDHYLLAEGSIGWASASVSWYTLSNGTLYPDEDNVYPTPGDFTFSEGYHF